MFYEQDTFHCMIDPNTGTFQLHQNILFGKGTGFDALKETLRQKGVPFKEEQHYGLFQVIYLNAQLDNKHFSFELFFDKKILSSMMFDFTCTGGAIETLEQWLTAQVGNLRQFTWGTVGTGEHPKFGVPLIKVKFL